RAAAPVGASPVIAAPVAAAPVAASPVAVAQAAATPVPASPVAPAAVPVPAVADLAGLMLAVVAEKTGYPVEMLDPEMDLEADLGIDSIKRVEILSTVRTRVPDLPQTAAAELAKLRDRKSVV